MLNLVWIFIIAVAVVTALTFFIVQLQKKNRQLRLLNKKYEALELKSQSLDIEKIQYKLNPHLFKNTLNAIQSHAYQTYYALDKLSNVLDFILYESDRKFVTLKEEMEFALSLIEINRLKVSPLFDLRVKNKVDADAPLYLQELIAPLITIDLIENAFKHADLQNESAFISIVFELKDDVFSLTVSNKISPVSPIRKEKSGFGRESLKKRLAYIYKKNYRLEQFIEGEVHISHLKLNLLEHKTEMLTAG